MQEQFLRRLTLKKTSEKSQELDEEGGYYTKQEMKDVLHYSAKLDRVTTSVTVWFSSSLMTHLFLSICDLRERADKTVAWCQDPRNGDDLILLFCSIWQLHACSPC